MAVIGGEPAPGDQQARPGDHTGLDRVANLDVEEVLLAHDPHRRGPRGEIRSEIRGGGERLGHGTAAELAELITEARDDRGMAVAVDQPGHHEAVREVERIGAWRRRDAVGRSDGGDPIAVDDDHRVADRRLSDTVEERAAADRAEYSRARPSVGRVRRHRPRSPGHEYTRSPLKTRPRPRGRSQSRARAWPPGRPL